MAELFTILELALDKRDTLTMTETYQEVGKATMANAPAGTYEFGMSLSTTYDTAQKSKFLRFSLDDGTSWSEFESEPSDKTNIEPFTYNFFKSGVSGALSLTVQARKEDAAGVMTVNFIDTYIRRAQ